MVKKSRKLAMVKRDTKKKISVTFTKRLFNKAAEFSMLCDPQIAVFVRSPSIEKPKRVAYSFGHTSVPNVINAFLNNSLPTNNVAADREINRCSVSAWNEINSAGTLAGGDHVPPKKIKNSMLKLEDFENCESVEELEKLVEGLEKLVDQVKRNPNFLNNSDNCDLLDLQDLDSDFNNGDDHQLMEIVESELKNCDKINNGDECAVVLPESKLKGFSFDNEYEDTHIPFVDYWPSDP